MRLALLPLVLWLLGGCGLVTSIVGGGGTGTVHRMRVIKVHRPTAQAQVVHAVNGRYTVQQVEQTFGSLGMHRAKVTSFVGGTVISYRRPFIVSVFVARRAYPQGRVPRGLRLRRVRRGNLEIFFAPAAGHLVGGALSALR